MCKTGEDSSSSIESSQVKSASAAHSKIIFTVEQLAQYDGVRSPQIYVAVNGIVWDVTDKVSGVASGLGLAAASEITCNASL